MTEQALTTYIANKSWINFYDPVEKNEILGLNGQNGMVFVD